MAKIILMIVATLLVASSVEISGHDLKSKLMHKFGIGHARQFGGPMSGGYSGKFGSAYGTSSASATATATGGYGGTSATSSATVGGGYGGSSASSSATVGSVGYGQHNNHYQQPLNNNNNYMWNAQQNQNGGSYATGTAMGGGYGSEATAAASVQNNYYVPAPAPVAQSVAPVEPQKPNFDINQFKVDQLGFRPYFGAGGVAATANNVATGGMGAATTAAINSGSYQQGGFVAPGTYAAASGTYANSNNNGLEQNHFSNEVNNMENHEVGHADDDHYYHAQSYGKAADDNDHINYNKNYENLISTPNVYHSVKSSETLLRDHNKSDRETGSAVMAKDHHSAGFQKHQKHFHQNANSAKVNGGMGGMGGGAYGSETDNLRDNMDYDDEMYYDSDGLNNQGQAINAVGMATNYGRSAGASAAVNSNMFGGSSSAAALGTSYGNGAGFGGVSASSAVN